MAEAGAITAPTLESLGLSRARPLVIVDVDEVLGLFMQGFGKFLMLIPVLTYVPLRVFVESWEESHRSLVLSLVLLVSAVVTLAIAATQDRKSGLEVFSRRAWTTDLMESQHLFFHLPIRIVGAAWLVASATSGGVRNCSRRAWT